MAFSSFKSILALLLGSFHCEVMQRISQHHLIRQQQSKNGVQQPLLWFRFHS